MSLRSIWQGADTALFSRDTHQCIRFVLIIQKLHNTAVGTCDDPLNFDSNRLSAGHHLSFDWNWQGAHTVLVLRESSVFTFRDNPSDDVVKLIL